MVCNYLEIWISFFSCCYPWLYLQSRNSQLTFHLPPPTSSAPATCLWLSLGLQNSTGTLTVLSSLKYLKDVYLQCNINNTNGCTSGITRDSLLRPCLRNRERKKEQCLPSRNSSIPHNLVSSNNCIRGLEGDCDIYLGPTLIIII